MAKCIKARVMHGSEKRVAGGKKKIFNNNLCQASTDSDISTYGCEARQSAFRNVKRRAQASEILSILQNQARRKENIKQTAF